MKPTAFVINVSRGGVVSEKDLLEALKKGEIGGAALDVFEHEPLDPDSPLLKLDNVFATPHVAGVTRQNNEGTGRIVAENIGLIKQGKTPLYCVNLAEVRRSREGAS
jgi:phosphoglycerate dehydrogenase-like enzyme